MRRSLSPIIIGILVGLESLVGRVGLAANRPTSLNSQNSKVEIDRIDFKGVNVFPSRTIESLLEIFPGDRLERLKVVRTEENLQSVYRAHGYEEVGIRSRLVRKKKLSGSDSDSLETVLEFEVTEGNPIRISSFEFLLDGPKDDHFHRSWKKREMRLLSSVGLSSGDILDQEKISDGKRAIQELLASEEYIGARVEDVRLVTEGEPNRSETEKLSKNASRWVKVQFHLSLGDRVTFGFRGNEYFTFSHLNSIVNDQRLLGLGKDYVGVIRSRLIEEYRAAGFARVEINPFTVETPNRSERKLTYAIQEGPRVKIESLEFDGNSVFSSQQLKDQFYSKASGLVQRGVYVEKDVQKAAELLVEWLQENGYLSAKLVTINSIYPPKARTQQAFGGIKLMIYLYEGDQTLVHSVKIQGAKALSEIEVKKILRLQEGAPLNLFAFGEGVETVKRVYRDKGYLGFKIVNEGSNDVIRYSQENRVADISFELDEGFQYRVSHVEIEGLSKTHDSIVRRELYFREGEVLEESQMIQSERQLRKLGIFSSVTVRATDDPDRDGYKLVRIILQEGDRGVLSWGPGLRNDLGVRIFSQLSYSNLWGLNHSASMTASVNRRFYLYNFVEGQAQLAYSWPWFLSKSNLTFRPSLSGGRTQFINFAADSISLAATWDKPLFSKPNLIGQFSYSLEKISQYNASTGLDREELQIGTITPRVTLDMRDNPLVPAAGFFATAWFDLATPFLASQRRPYPIGYYRAQFRGDYYLPLPRNLVWYFSFRTGYERSLEHTRSENDPKEDPYRDAIPLIKQFALGGVGSLRGYQLQALNYQTVPIRGSLSYVNYRTQLDIPVSGALKFGMFLDAANLMIDRYSFGDLLLGPGFGVHYQTPFGDVNFDIGFRVPNNNPNAFQLDNSNTDRYQIHFSVGVI